jgi:DNA anti-recombination protein RmuC
MSTEGKIRHIKRNFNKLNQKTKKMVDDLNTKLQGKLSKAHEDINYFLGQISSAEERIGSLNEEITELTIAQEKRERRGERKSTTTPSKPKEFTKISVSDALSKYK